MPAILNFIHAEVQTSGRSHGYRMMRQWCMDNGLHVRTQDVATILRVYDPVVQCKAPCVHKYSNKWDLKAYMGKPSDEEHYRYNQCKNVQMEYDEAHEKAP